MEQAGGSGRASVDIWTVKQGRRGGGVEGWNRLSAKRGMTGIQFVLCVWAVPISGPKSFSETNDILALRHQLRTATVAATGKPMFAAPGETARPAHTLSCAQCILGRGITSKRDDHHHHHHRPKITPHFPTIVVSLLLCTKLKQPRGRLYTVHNHTPHPEKIRAKGTVCK